MYQTMILKDDNNQIITFYFSSLTHLEPKSRALMGCCKISWLTPHCSKEPTERSYLEIPKNAMLPFSSWKFKNRLGFLGSTTFPLWQQNTTAVEARDMAVQRHRYNEWNLPLWRWKVSSCSRGQLGAMCGTSPSCVSVRFWSGGWGEETYWSRCRLWLQLLATANNGRILAFCPVFWFYIRLATSIVAAYSAKSQRIESFMSD